MKKYFLTFVVVIFSIISTQAQAVWDKSHLEYVKSHLNESIYSASFQYLKAKADSIMFEKPLSVMDKEQTAASGDRHDYLSQARYTWRNPNTPDGLPYIHRDGITNPEIEKLDRIPLGKMSDAVKMLSLAYYFSGNAAYAQKAVDFLKTWFIDSETRMNPNFNYAQIVPGENGNKGRSYGILDGDSFVEILDAVCLLNASGMLPDKDMGKLKKWFAELLQWMLTSELGKEESNATNNHGTIFDKQVIAYALFSGKLDIAETTIRNFYEKRIKSQIEADGTQPHELWRTLAFGYSVYNLHQMIDVMLMAENYGIDFIGHNEIACALHFLDKYIGNRPAWEGKYQQISQWDEKEQMLIRDIHRFMNICSSKISNEYSRAFTPTLQKVKRDYADTWWLLNYKPSFADNALYDVELQMNYAIQCAEEALKIRKNKELVSPRCMEKDGSMRLVHPHDWCSGFFPGVLWQLYEYTGNQEWKDWAVTYTWPIERAKWHKGTHDLGFMMYDTFGKAYDLDGEDSYKQVWLQSAKTLITRYDDKVGLIRSWDHNAEVWKYPVIIDNLMNLELLFRATEETGDSTFYNIAVSHADITLENHFRPDNSSYHVVDYDPQTGDVRMKCTAQGYSDESVWSRGQAWGLYGYTVAYRYTGDTRYLKQARCIYQFFFNQDNLPDDLIPYWDMKAPAIPNEPRDASAAAIFASGLYELAQYTEGEESARNIETADKITQNLYETYRSEIGKNQGFILLHSTGNYPAGDEIDVPIGYADYYYIEALIRRSRLH